MTVVGCLCVWAKFSERYKRVAIWHFPLQPTNTTARSSLTGGGNEHKYDYSFFILLFSLTFFLFFHCVDPVNLCEYPFLVEAGQKADSNSHLIL